ncbi:sulfurtransferase [Pseudotenacibaculum sp. MALMAid0570]|uniref:sulfurtransferase n=1 Tax=Pseudotenacibaculum sp. MALMAid0570 TaxID=3143938 RepID=UPI0032DE73A1
MLKVPSAIVDCSWLNQHLKDEDLIILNATIPKVTAKGAIPIGDNSQIPFSRFFDIKQTFSLKNAEFPNTMLSEEEFEKNARGLGINNESCIVVYDTHGVYSSPRAWWMFKAMGFDNIAVLDGGLPEWISKGFETEEQLGTKYIKGNFKANLQKEKFVNSEFVLSTLNDSEKLILDARSIGRFKGKDPEPRKNVRSGHIPSSKNLPYSTLLSKGKLKTKEELRLLYKEVAKDKQQMIFSCGTGITACVLALGAELAGYEDFVVYDGSWTEWGSILELPIEV